MGPVFGDGEREPMKQRTMYGKDGFWLNGEDTRLTFFNEYDSFVLSPEVEAWCAEYITQYHISGDQFNTGVIIWFDEYNDFLYFKMRWQ